jgi:hypothetical protein
MRKFLLIILLNSLFCGSLLCKDIGETMKSDAGSLWSLPVDKFKTDFGPAELYKWQAFDKTLLYKFTSGKTKLYFLGQQIYKASFKFPARSVNGMYLTLKKPPAKTDKDTYLKSITDLQEKIKALDKFPTAKVIKRKSGKWYRYSCAWKSPQYSISLRWSYSGNSKAPFKTQSTKLSVFYSGAQLVSEKKMPEKGLTETASQNADNGDFYLKVPMMTEASPKKSLSTCASRVMAFYAQQANKDLNENKYNFSNPANVRYDIKDMLKKSFSIKEVESSECFEDYIKFSSLIYAYNGYAKNRIKGQYNKIINSSKRLKKTNYILIKTINHNSKKNKIYVYLTNMIEIVLKMNEEDAWIKMHCRRKSEVKKFKKKICKQILAGKPVVWDVILGIVKEKNAPPVRGKYVRLIVGYNDKTNELIYSDSLGKGHELKKMTWDKAWAITYKTIIINSKKKSKRL